MTDWTFPRVSAVLVTPPAIEPISLEDLKLRARHDRTDEDALLLGFIQAARQQVERDTDRALLTQTWRAVVVAPYGPIEVPWPPLQAVTKVTVQTAEGTSVLDPSLYVVDTVSAPGRVLISGMGAAAVEIEYVAGWPDVAHLPPLLVHAVGLLAAHYLTVGRDLATVGTIISTTVAGYAEAVAPYRLVGVP
jgi:uncharacterized phiE125 gp8 family phage protein